MKLRLHHIEMCVKDPAPVIGTLNQQFGLELVGKRETTLCSQSVLKLGRTVFVVTSRKTLSPVSSLSPNNNVLDNSKNNCDEPLNGKGHYVNNIINNNKQVNSIEQENGKDDKDHEEEEAFTTKSNESVQKRKKNSNEPWTIFCCEDKNLDLDSNNTSNQNDHIDSVFNIAIEVTDLTSCINRLEKMNCVIVRDVTNTSDKYGSVKYAIVKSCCGNVIHTLIEKINYTGWFLPGFQSFSVPVPTSDFQTKATTTTFSSSSSCSNSVTLQQSTLAISYFDHVALVCHIGESNSILSWYQQAFEMKRFITNRQETEEEGLVIGDDVGMRLKVLEFWKCSEVGLASTYSNEDGNDHSDWEPLKIVVVESLPTIKNTQVENFIKDHKGPGLQHIGLHTSDMMNTVRELVERGVRFRYPPPTYYTEIGQLASIQAVGENPEKLSKYGVLLDTEADVFEDEEEMEETVILEGNETTDKTLNDSTHKIPRYLMQIFTYPIFDRDTFFLEVIQRKGARGFGVGNVTALARSVNAYQKQLLDERAEGKRQKSN